MAATAAEGLLSGPEIIERAGLKAWPGIEVEWDGQWVRRAANGYTKRANSVQSLDRGDDANAEARISAAASWFEDRGLTPVFRVTPLAVPATVRALDEAGWDSVDHSFLVAMPLCEVEPDPRARLFNPLDMVFIGAQRRLQGYSDATVDKLRALLRVMTVPAKGVVVFSGDGEPVASGLMAIADGIVITGNVVTLPGHRRQGYAAAMMRTGLSWAREAGATIAALNVAAENTPARALYAGLGYRRQYDYRYRVPARR